MKCKQIREAIDAASRDNLYSGYVKSHLDGCPDCHRYSDETKSLLALLSAHPRVEAPPDFEFRLRARIARAQTARANSLQSFLRKIRPEAFSRAQMGAAMAALALVVTVSILHINRDERTPAPGGVVAADVGADLQARETEPAPEIKALAIELPRAAARKFAGRSEKVTTASIRPAVSPNNAAIIDTSTRLYNPETKQLLKDRSRFYGAETASISMARPAGIAFTF